MYYLEKAPVSKAILHMAIPMVLGMVVNMIYNITDAYFVGLLNNTSSLAAITLALPFTTILMALGELFGTGGSTYISRLLGEKNIDGVKKASAVNFYLSFLTGGAVCNYLSAIFESHSESFGGNRRSLYSYTRLYTSFCCWRTIHGS